MNIIGKRRWFFGITGVVLVVCIMFIAVFGLKSGVEFSSGSVMTIGFEEEVTKESLETSLSGLGYTDVIIQEVGESDLLVRLPRLTSDEKVTLETELQAEFEGMVIREFDDVSEMVAAETTRNAAIAVGVAAVGVLLYIAWAFRKMPKPFHYGICAVVALLHDTLVALGIFALLGKIYGWEVDMQLIIGILTVIGYSVNNTVVVFDRIRENQLNNVRNSYETIVNNSLVETLTRCLNTSLTTLFAVIALMIFVGTAIQNFCIILLLGLIAGTYSATIIAPSLLVAWDSRKGKAEA